MTPEFEKQAKAAYQRMADRLVEVGFAHGWGINDDAGKGILDLTPEGAQLSDALRRIFPQQDKADYFAVVSLVQLLLSSRTPDH